METQPTEKKEQVLIVYFSHTNSTKSIAEYIREQTTGTLFRIVPETAYPEQHEKAVETVQEQNKTNFLPALKDNPGDLSRYTTVFLGFPVWDKRLPPPVRCFLKQYNFAGKTIFPFHTHSGFGSGTSIAEIREFCPEATIATAFLEQDKNIPHIKPELTRWLRESEKMTS